MRGKKIRSILLALCATLTLLGGLSAPSYAQEYSFTLDREIVDVWINPDGSVRIEYWFTFTCDRGDYHIDAVDVGLPTGAYKLSDIRADMDGRPVARIDSDYQGKGDHGVAVWLGDATLRSGETGTLHVVIERVGEMVYVDSQDPQYASTEFSPTWFGSEYVHGKTDMVVRFHLPPGVQAEEPRWHRSPSGWGQSQPDTGWDDAGRVVYIWRNTAADPDRQYIFGASFPRSYMAEGAVLRPPSLLEKLFAALITLVCNPATCFFLFVGGLMFIGNRLQQRRKMQYLPPTMKVEGVGIKRGLTAVEAAILLETPLNKVLTMILFSLLKKGVVTVLDDDPLRIEVHKPLPEGLRAYEKKFLQAVKQDGSLDEGELRSLVTGLIKGVNTQLKGFSRKETTAYYRDIVQRAWQQIEAADTPEVRSQRFDEALEWGMMDKDFSERTERLFRSGPVYVPMWWGYYRPWSHVARPRAAAPPAGGAQGRPSAAGPAPSLPTLPGAAFAASIVRGVENASSRVVRSLSDFTGQVTEVTNPPPKPSSSGGGGRSGGCACACACAGCACACAGGGR